MTGCVYENYYISLLYTHFSTEDGVKATLIVALPSGIGGLLVLLLICAIVAVILTYRKRKKRRRDYEPLEPAHPEPDHSEHVTLLGSGIVSGERVEKDRPLRPSGTLMTQPLPFYNENHRHS